MQISKRDEMVGYLKIKLETAVRDRPTDEQGCLQGGFSPP